MTANDILATPEHGNIKVPSGHILVHEKWRSSELGSQLKSVANIAYSDAMGFVDFYLTRNSPVVYLTESDLVIDRKRCEEKLDKLRNICNGNGIVTLVRNSSTIKEFNEIQEYAVLKLDLFVFPVGCQSELPLTLQKLAIHHTKSPTNPGKRKSKSAVPMKNHQISLLLNIPSIGEEKAKLLLERFGNVKSIGEASLDSLIRVLGSKSARQVYNSFQEFHV